MRGLRARSAFGQVGFRILLEVVHFTPEPGLSLPANPDAMIQITLPDGSIRQAEDGATAMDVARDISEGLARNVLAAEVDGEIRDAQRPLGGDVTLNLLTWGSEGAKSTLWHSGAHLMAEALEALYPGVKFWVGPAVEGGFYYDVDFGDHTFSDKDFPTVE